MGNYTRDEVLQMAEDEDVEFMELHGKRNPRG